MNKQDIAVNALLGQAAGDAFGVPVEFMSREQVRRLDLREMIGCDTQPQPDSRWGELEYLAGLFSACFAEEANREKTDTNDSEG